MGKTLSPALVTILILFTVSLAIRMYNISFQSLWIDEGATFYFSHFSLKELIDIREFTPPPFYMMEHILITAFGETELVMRAPFAIIGALSVAMTYIVFSKMFSGNIALLTAVLLLFSPIHIYHSQDARPYTLVMFLILLQLYFYIGISGTKEKRPRILFVVFACLALYFSYYAIIPTALMFIHWGYMSGRSVSAGGRSDLKDIATYGFLFSVFSSPVIYLALTTAGNVVATGEKGLAGAGFIMYTLEHFLYWNVLAAVVLLLLAFIGMFLCYKKCPEQFRLILLLIIFPLLITMCLSFFMRAYYRYILFSLPLYYAAVACCIYAARSDAEQRKLTIIGVACVTVIGSALLVPYYTTPTKADFRGVAGILGDMSEEGDYILYIPDIVELSYGPLSFYYDKPGVEFFGVETTEEIDEICSSAAGKVFVMVCTDPGEYSQEYYHSMIGWLEGHGELLFEKCNIYLYLM